MNSCPALSDVKIPQSVIEGLTPGPRPVGKGAHMPRRHKTYQNAIVTFMDILGFARRVEQGMSPRAINKLLVPFPVT